MTEKNKEKEKEEKNCWHCGAPMECIDGGYYTCSGCHRKVAIDEE